MAKFNVGDKVVVTGLGSQSASFGVIKGMTGVVVVSKSPHTDNVGVKFEEPINGNCLYCNHIPTLVGEDAEKGLWIEPENLELTEEPEMTQQFKAMKIRIKDEQHSRLVQKALFEMGYRWSYGNEEFRHTGRAFIYTEDNGYLLHGYLIGGFNADKSEEVELVTTYSFKPVDQEAKRKREEREALEKNVAEMQKQLDEMKQKLNNF